MGQRLHLLYGDTQRKLKARIEKMERETFGSRLGFLLVSAGCAIGIGNVWKFPYIVGQNGGGIFVLFYLIFLMLLGIPVLTMELAVGRASRKSAVKAYQYLEPAGSKWHLHGWVAIIGCYLLMMYYTTVSGWMLSYFVKFITGTFSGDAVDTAAVFGNMLGNPAEMLFYMILTVLLGFGACGGGVKNGIEKISKVIMSALLVLIILLAIHSLTLSGAKSGLAFYLVPSLERAKQAGIGSIITSAMNQSFFTLSLGIAAMEIFGSYMSDSFTLGGEAVRICALDTFVALASGLIIFPACFSYSIEPDAGPSLIFITLPRVFAAMPGGRIWGSLFFLFMTFASLSTVIAVFENIIASMMDNCGWSRKKAVIVNLVIILIGSLPCALGYNVLSGVHLIGGRDILDSEDYIVSNLLLPIGSLVYLLFCVTRWGWGAKAYLSETNRGKGIMLSARLIPVFQFVLPALILIILIQGLL